MKKTVKFPKLSLRFWPEGLVIAACVASAGIFFLLSTASSRAPAQPGTTAYIKAKKSVALLSEGQRRHREGNLSGAERSLQEALKIEPRLIAAWSELGLVYAKWNRTDDAIQAFEQVYDHRDPSVNGTTVTQPIPNYVYAQLCHEKGLFRQEREAYDRILSERTILKTTPLSGADMMALVHLMVGDDYRHEDRQLAADQYQKAIALKPTHGELLWELSWRNTDDPALQLKVLKWLAASKENSDYPRQASERLLTFGDGARTSTDSKGALFPPTPEDEKRFDARRKELARIGSQRVYRTPTK